MRLYSVTGCRTIEWDKPKARELLLQRRKHNVHMEGSTNAAFSTKYDKSAFDCCIASKYTTEYTILNCTVYTILYLL